MSNSQDGHPQSLQAARKFLERLYDNRSNRLKTDDEVQQRWNQNHIDSIRRDLRNPAQVLPELIQNADDVENCSRIVIQFTESTLRVWNDGRSMRRSEIESLCGLGDSTKPMSDRDHIGHFGRGFKSVFSVSNNPQIRSGYFHFSFDKDSLIIPEILSTPKSLLAGTEIVLPLKKELRSDEQEQLETRIDSIEQLLPYLRNVREITVNDHGDVTQYRREEDNSECVKEVAITRDGTEVKRWKHFSTTGVPTGDARKEFVDFRLNGDKEPSNFSEDELSTEITIAIPVNKDGKPKPAPNKSRLFNYLPTDDRPQIPFDVQADFLLESDRQSLSRPDGPYNQWLLEQTADAFLKFVRYYKSNSETTAGHLQAFPTDSGLKSPFDTIRTEIIDRLEDVKFIPTAGGGWATPAEVVAPTERLREALDAATLSTVLAENIRYPSSEIEQSIITDLTDYILDERSIADVAIACTDDDSVSLVELDRPDLFKFVIALGEYWSGHIENTRRYRRSDDEKKLVSAVKDLNVFPLHAKGRSTYNELDEKPVLPPKQTRGVLNTVREQLPIVQLEAQNEQAQGDSTQEATSTQQTQQEIGNEVRDHYETIYGIESLTYTTAIKRVIAAAFENPHAIADETLDEYLRFMFRNEDRWSAGQEYVPLKLRTRNNGYVDPAKTPVFFSDAYLTEYSLESLLQNVDATVLSEEYLELTDHDSDRWRSFLIGFDVREKLRVSAEQKRTREKFKSEERLRDYLGDRGERVEVPNSRQKSGGTDQWLHGYNYAICDYEESDTFKSILKTFTNDDRSVEAGEEVAKMLDSHWREYYSEKFYLDLNYVHKPSRTIRVAKTETELYSAFAKRLRETPWFPAEDGNLVIPPVLVSGDIVSTGNVSVQKAGYTPTQNCRRDLGITSQLDLDTIIKILTQAPRVWGGESPAKIRSELKDLFDSIQFRLEQSDKEERQRVISDLRSARCIYQEDATTAFRTPSEVAWQGHDLGDYLVTIDDAYRPYRELLSELGVRERISVEAHFEYLAECKTVNDVAQITSVWLRTVSKLADTIEEYQDSTEEPGILQFLQNEPCLPTEAGTFATLSEVDYYCRDAELREHLTDKSLKEQTVRGVRISDGQRRTKLWDSLELSTLSSNLELSIKTDIEETETNEALLDNEDVNRLFDVAYSFAQAKMSEATARELSEKELQRLARNFTIQRSSELVVQYVRPLSQQTVSESFTVDCHIDEAAQNVYFCSGIDSLYEFSERFVDRFNQGDTDQLEDVLSGALGKQQKHLEAYLENRDIPYREFTIRPSRNETDNGEETEQPTNEITAESESTTTPENRTKVDGVDTNGNQTSSPAKTASGTEAAQNQEENNSESTSTDTKPSPDEANSPVPTTNTAQTKSAASDTVDESSSAPASSQTSPSSASTGSSSSGSDSPKTSSTSQNVTRQSHDATRSSDNRFKTIETAKKSEEQRKQAPASNPSREDVTPVAEAVEQTGELLSSYQHTQAKQRERGNTEHSGGGGSGGGGSRARKSGEWGEDFVFEQLTEFLKAKLPVSVENDELRTVREWAPLSNGDSETATKWSEFSGLDCDRFAATIPGIRFESEALDQPVQLLHIRELNHGADIYIDGAAIRLKEDAENDSYELELTAVGPTANTWIEAKSTIETRRRFGLSKNEYRRACTENNRYLIFRLWKAQTEEPVIDTILTRLPELEEKNMTTVSLNGDITLEY